MGALGKLLHDKLSPKGYRRMANCGGLLQKPKLHQFYAPVAVTETRQLSRNASCSSEITPKGYLPIYVGDQEKRCVIKAKYLNHPMIAELLERSAQEYGYSQSGALRILCDAEIFESILASTRKSER